MTSNNDEIRRMAYRLWEEEGRPEGKSLEHWSRAVAMLDPDVPTTTQALAVITSPAKAKPAAAAKKPAARRSGKAISKPRG